MTYILKVPYLFFLGIILAVMPRVHAQDQAFEEKLGVSLRMIGHQVLLQAGDSSSRVLPIRKEEDQYIIEFESEFGLNPDSLFEAVSEAAAESIVWNHYVLEVKECETDDVVYSYVVNEWQGQDIVPCKARALPRACYRIHLSFLEPEVPLMDAEAETAGADENITGYDQRSSWFLALAILLTGGLLLFLRKQKAEAPADPNLIVLGSIQFDTRNIELVTKNERIELSGKEAELLRILCESANTTIERDVLLNKVWGDEGDYIGRTLDVFISKLRKKLESDPSVKIVNIRGVGYKLVLNV